MWIDELLKQMGYERDRRLHVCWSPPGNDMVVGLVFGEKDSDIVAMLKIRVLFCLLITLISSSVCEM